MRPVIFLDVDGVINSLQHLYGRSCWQAPDDPTVQEHYVNPYNLYVPDYMPGLLVALHAVTDIYWLTTWREEANEKISPLVGLPNDLPVLIDTDDVALALPNLLDGSVDVPSWKAEVAEQTARGLERPVYWIEDFGGVHSTSPGLQLIDTDAHGEGVLLPQHLAASGLLRLAVSAGYVGPETVRSPARP